MKENRHQLETLLRCFYEEAQAAHFAEEIEAGEKLLANDSPLPRPEVLANIKQALRQRTAALARRRHFYRQVLTAAAACLAAGVGLLWSLHRQSPDAISVPTVTLQSSLVQDFFTDDSVSEISSKLDDITEQLHTDSSSNKVDSWEAEINNEIEEMVVIAQADFWKG